MEQPSTSTDPTATQGTPDAREGQELSGHSFHAFADTIPIQLEEEYRLIAEAIPQIVWTARPDGYNDYFNQRWFEYTGISQEATYDPANQGWPDYPDELHPSGQSALHPEDYAHYTRRWREALRSGKSYEIEYRFRRASDGMYRWHLGRAIPIRDSDGSIVKWFGTCTDIHDQKLAQEQMRNHNQELERKVAARTEELHGSREKDRANLQRLKEVIQNLPQGAMTLDEEDNLLHVNKQFGTLFGLPNAPDFIGKKGKELRKIIKAGSIYPEQYVRHLEDVILKRKVRMGEEIHLKDGRIIARDYIPIFDTETYRGCLLLYRDVTKEKRVDASKSEFMSLASHQLRTPLTTIRWTLGRLERRLGASLDAQQSYLLREGKKAAVRMADTIDTMLAISRIEAGKIKLDISHVTLLPLLEEIVHEFHEDLQRKQQKILVTCDADVDIHSDHHFLREILLNLVSNAVKYTPDKGDIRIDVSMDSHTARIDVRDSGYGIPSHQQDKIFSKFFRGDNILQHDTNGTGLGLYLVFLLTRILRGEISFVSAEGEGTTFTLKLPRAFYDV